MVIWEYAMQIANISWVSQTMYSLSVYGDELSGNAIRDTAAIWDYHYKDGTTALNNIKLMGKNGWELVSITPRKYTMVKETRLIIHGIYVY